MSIFKMNRTLDNYYLIQQNFGKVVSTVILIFAISYVAHTQKAGNTSRMTGPSGQEYETVRIGDQVWMKENLNTDRFANGEEIDEARSPDEWKKARINKIPAWSHYDNKKEYGRHYGKIYNWHAVTDQRGICPDGWHVPIEEDWKELMVYLGMKPEIYEEFGWRGEIAPALTSRRTEPEPHPRWDAPNDRATNSSGFSALPGGYRVGDPNYEAQQENLFRYLGKEATFWSGENQIGWGLWTDRKEVFRGGSNLTRGFGFSVRCIQSE